MRSGILRTLGAILFCGCFGIPTALPSYGEPTMSGRPPLAREFGSGPGAYESVILISQPIADPGGRLQVEVYLSGYGVIQAAKVAFYPSPSVFTISRSVVATADDKPGPIDPLGMVASPDASRLFDAKGKYRISTECRTPRGNAPINLDLEVSGTAKPGPHSIQFVLTYFDGQTWKMASKNADFTIRNFYQRHEGPIWWVGGIAAGLTILASAVTLWPAVRGHWPISVVLAALGGIAAAGGKAISERRKCSRAR
jgi:hypothetical protein